MTDRAATLAGLTALWLLAVGLGLGDRSGMLQKLPELLQADRNGLAEGPTVWKWADPSQFPRDVLLARFVEIQPTASLWIRHQLGRRLDPRVATAASYLLLNLAFVVGAWRFYRDTIGVRPAWLATAWALCWMFPGPTWEARWGAVPLDWLSYRGMALAAAPWILWGAYRLSRSRWLPAGFGVLGAAARLDPSGLAHAAAAALGGAAAAAGPASASRIGAGLALFVAGWAVSSGTFLQGGFGPDLDALRILDSPSVSPHLPGGAADVLRGVLPLGLPAGLLLLAARVDWTPGLRCLVGVACAGLAGVTVALLAPSIPPLVVGQAQRMGRFAFVGAFGILAACLAVPWRSRAWLRWTAVGGMFLVTLSRWVPPASALTPAVGPPLLRSAAFPGDEAAQVHLGGWVRKATPDSALFLVPPDGGDMFRFHARRSIVVSRYDGLSAHYSRSFGALWRERYVTVYRAYETGPEAVLAAARRFGCEYVVTAARAGLPGTPLFRNIAYAVWRVP